MQLCIMHVYCMCVHWLFVVLCVRVCVRACARMHVFVRACGCVGGRRSWHSGIWKGDFHSKQTVEAEI